MKILTFLFALTISFNALAGTWRDDFSDGNYEGWTVQNIRGGISEWKVESGELIAKRSNDWSSFVILDESIGWEDYEFEFDAMFMESLNPNFTFIVINVRVSENSINFNSIGPALAYNWQGQRGRIVYARGVKGAQDVNLVDIVEQNYPVEMNKYYRLKLSAIGDQYRLYIDNVLQREYNFAGYKSGGVAIGAGGCIAYFDNVSISGPNIPNGGSGFNSVFPKHKLTTTWSQIRRER